jgi:hypothetical protein
MPFLPHLPNIALESLPRKKRRGGGGSLRSAGRKSDMKGIQLEKKKAKPSLFTSEMILYGENLKNSIKPVRTNKRIQKSCSIPKKKISTSQEPVAHGSKPAQIVRKTVSWKALFKNRAGGMAQHEGPEFKPQYHKKQNKTKISTQKRAVYFCTLAMTKVKKELRKKKSNSNST